MTGIGEHDVHGSHVTQLAQQLPLFSSHMPVTNLACLSVGTQIFWVRP